MPVISESKKFLVLFLVWIMAILPLMQAAAEQRARAGTEQAEMLWPADPALPAAMTATSTPPSRSGANRPFSRMHAAATVAMMQSPTLAVSVGYADNLRPNPNFPIPWEGSPNTTFIGQGPTFDAGAIRLDNNSSSPITVDSVVVDLGRPGPTFNLWGSFTIAPNSTVILTQTNSATENFDTSDFPIVGCGQPLSPNETRIPKVTVTIAGTPATFTDSGHILDTGGFDLVCQGNESLGWRPIGTTGIQNTSAHVTLNPATSIQATGSPYTATAQVTDASNQPTANVVVDFLVLNGPNAGKTGQATTDATGTAAFTYTSLAVGTDILQATVTNAAGGSIQSDQVTTTWTSSNPCSPSATQSSNSSATTISFAGQGVGEFNDPLTLAAQLVDGSGNPLAGRSLSFILAEQPFQATTDGNGVATVSVSAAPAPGVLALNVQFAGETNFQPSQLTTTVTIGKEETVIRYTGSTLLGTGVTQQVTATLVDGQSGAPIANKTVTFSEGSAQAQGTTNAQGVAAATLTLASSPASGQTALQVSFAGDNLYKASRTSVPVTVYLPTSFVVWGGNSGGLQLGQDVNFWGHSWTNQVTGGNFTAFTANPSFKGFADPVSQVNICEVSAGSGGPLDDSCWSSKPGNSFPPATLPPFIQVIVSTAITMSGSTGEIFGNIASTAVCHVDPKPVYGSDPGKPGFCKLVAVLQDGANIFPTPPALTATQTQPPRVLPQQNFNVIATITNNSNTPASSVVLNESFDGVTPTTGATSIGSILNGAQQTETFQVTSPTIPLRQSSESTADYETRLANTDGRVFTSTGTITFTDSVGQQFLPVTVSSSSQLQLPELTVGISGPSCVGPGSTIPYKVTVSNQGTAEARNVSILMNFPDGSNTTATIASIPIAGSVTTTINFVVPAISARQPNETDQQYRARLAAVDDSSLVALAKVNWQDALGNNYGDIQQKIVTTTERVPIIIVTPQLPAAVSPGQQVTLNLSVQNLGGGNASQVLLKVTNPDGSTSTIAPFALQGGQANVVSSTFTAPVVPARQAGETDAAYQARLVSQDGKPLNFQVSLNWNDVAGDSYGPTTTPAMTSLVVPIVTISLTVPPISQSGATITYTVSGTNIGHADASSTVANITLPDGSTGQLFSGTVPLQSTFQQFVNFTVPRTTSAGTLSTTAAVNWKDASQDSYGPLSSTATTANTVPQNTPPPTGNGAALQLTPLTAGPNNTGTQQTVTATLKDNSSNPLSGVAVQFTVFGANPTSGSATTGPTGNASFTYIGANPGNDQVVAMATSNGSTAISNSSQIVWIAPVPVVGGWIGSPANGAVVSTPLPISLQSVTLQSGTVSFFPSANPSAVTILNPNAAGPAGTTLATFDPTTLANGSYIIQVQGTDSSGNQQTNVVQVTVIGVNKPGRVLFSATDLKIPLAGISISITRTYDSLKRGTVQDFGFGWSLSTSVDLQVDASNNVSFTVNGQRSTFFFQPQPSSFLFPWLLLPTYVPQPGLHGSLASDGCDALIQTQGLLTCFVGGPYQPTTFVYTDPIGRVYTISANGQIQSIQDTNGNLLTFGANGIISSSGGISVPFVRDNQGRITQITDLNHNNYIYNYDSSGNLASVNLPGTTSSDVYNYGPDHLLTGETDPRGNLTAIGYFPDGRLQSITDGFGNTTTYSYNLAGNITTITFPDGGVTVQTNDAFGNTVSLQDPLNRTTTFTYDANHNLTSTTDPLGNTTTYTYDANGNQTSVTDPLQHTRSKVYNQFGEITSQTDAVGNVTTISYDSAFNPIKESDSLGVLLAGTVDSQGNVTSITNANAQTKQFVHDANGNVTKVTDPLNQITTYTYDAMNRMTSKTDPRNNTTSYGYDALGHLTSVTDANHNVTRYIYDDAGNKTAQIDALGRQTTYAYDAVNRLSKITYPDQTTRRYTYDFRGNKLTDTDQLGQVTRYVYDLAGQLTSVTYAFGTADAATVSYTYDLAGRKATESDGRGNVKTLGYDAAGQLTTVKDALGNVTTIAHDAEGRLASITDANQHATSFTFDARRRLTAVTYPDGTTRKFTHDGMGNQLSLTDRANRTTAMTYDAINRLVSVINAAGLVTQYTYDGANNLTSITDAAAHLTSFQYDNLSRQTMRKLPLGMFETNAYDAVGNMTSRTDFNGKVTTFSYDTLNRLLQKLPDTSLNQPTVKFTYTATGHRASMSDASGTTSYAYDNRDRLISKATPAGTLNYTYDGAGNVLTLASSNTNGVSMTYTYDADDRLSTATDNRLLAQGASSAVTSYSYDQVGNLAGYTYPNGIQTNHVYDTVNRLTQISSSKSGLLSSFIYSLGPEGNQLSASELGGRLVNYAYDAVYRLASEAITGDPGGNNGTVGYTYDAAGNRLQMNSTLAAVPSGLFSYDANDRLTTDTYDNNGNTISSAGISSSYDFEDRLIAHGAVSIVYDGDGNRVAETVAGVTTRYLVDDRNPSGHPQVVDELVNGLVTRTYAYGLSRVSQNQLLNGSRSSSFYGYDGHGSVRFLTNLAGAQTDSYQFDAFGNTLAATGTTPNNFLFSGEQSDAALGFYYLRARYLNPLTGRFLTMDPLPGDIKDPGSLHRYLYAGDDPVNRIDPSGLQEVAAYAALLSASFAYAEFPEKIGKCEFELFIGVGNALTDAVNDFAVPPNEGQEAGYKYIQCLYEAFVVSWKDVAEKLSDTLIDDLEERFYVGDVFSIGITHLQQAIEEYLDSRGIGGSWPEN